MTDPIREFRSCDEADREVERLREALRFYRDNWRTEMNEGPPGEYSPDVVPTDALWDDCGALAAEVLGAEGKE